LHRTIAAVRDDMAGLKFNTAIARCFELNNRLTQVVADHGAAPLEIVVPLVLMLAPLTPHIAEELWARLGNDDSLTYEAFPVADPALLVEDEVEIPVQVNGKVRGHVSVPADATAEVIEASARVEPKIATLLEGATIRKVVAIPGRMVNFVVG
jgi:leucyl-tRNA synthetase